MVLAQSQGVALMRGAASNTGFMVDSTIISKDGAQTNAIPK